MNNQDYNKSISNPNLPATVEDVKIIACHADNIVKNVSNTINNVAIKAAEIKQIAADVEIQCAQLDHALDCLMLKVQRDIKIYEQSLPILDKQFSFCQTRLDKLMDNAMNMIGSDFSDTALARQEAMMSLIEIANTSLNSLIAKLIPTY